MFQKDWILETNSTWNPFFQTGQMSCNTSLSQVSGMLKSYFFPSSIYQCSAPPLWILLKKSVAKKKVTERLLHKKIRFCMSCYSVYCPVLNFFVVLFHSRMFNGTRAP